MPSAFNQNSKLTGLPEASGASAGEEVFIFPTTVAQHRFWLLDQLQPGNPALNVPLAARLTGRIDRDLLERAVNEVIRRHEILRTSFQTVKDEVVQVIHAERKIRLAWFDLTLDSEAQREAETNRLILEEGKRGFILTEGPFLRGGLIKLREDEHILLLTMHHIVCDGWSNGILIQDVARAYVALGQGQELPELPLQYPDYAQWQKDWLSAPAIIEQRRFWQLQLQGVLPLVNLPTDHPRKASRSNNSAIHTLLLPQPLTEALKDFCNRENLTPFMVLFAAYASLLYRCTGQRDLIVGSPAANRSQPELEELIGLFSNPLIMRLNFSDQFTLRSLLVRIKELALEVFEHQSYPFEKVIEEIRTNPHRQGLQLLQAYFIFQKAFMQPQQMSGVTLTPLRSVSPGTLFEWMLGILERAEGIRLQLEYNTDLFEEATIDRTLHHFQQILETIVTNHDVRIDFLPMLTPAEYQQLVLDRNGTQMEIPNDQNVVVLFEEQAVRTPDAPAIKTGNHQLSYAQLDRRANQLAHFFKEHEAMPQKLVGLFMAESDPEFPACFLGVLKAGACCVVLDPNQDDAELARQLHLGSLDLIVSGSRLSPTLRLPGPSPVVNLEEAAALISERPNTGMVSSARAEQPACVLFTSAFSGTKKGAMISHRAFLNSALVARHELGLQHGDCVTFSLTEMFPALLAGATLVFQNNLGEFNATDWWRWVRGNGLTVAALPTPHWHELVKILAHDTDGRVPKLRTLAIGGSQVSPKAVSAWQQATAGRIQLLDRFLLAETAGAVAFTKLSATEPATGRVLIARPALNAQIYLLDDNLQPVPAGVLGNLYVGGSSLASGYWPAAKTSDAHFVTVNFTGPQGTRLLKTGDTGRFLAGGGIELLGRWEDLANTEGFRLELCEIRSTLLRYPKVWDAVVIPQLTSGEKRVVAYVLPTEENPSLGENLRVFMTEELPAYMVPAEFISIPALPLTHGGKINRQALTVSRATPLESKDRFAAPGTPNEVALANIWRKLLGVDEISIHANFFAIGGHSLLAIRMVQEVRRQLAPAMPVRLPFQFPTIQELAKALLTQETATWKPELIQLRAGNSGPQLVFLIDEGSLGLFKLSHLMSHDLSLYASVVPLPKSALKASAEKCLAELPTMEELAAGHVDLIRNRQLTGPLVLAGHCFGGRLAFEVARQLQHGGQAVEAILMLDTWMARPSLWWRKKTWFQAHFRKLLQQGPGYLWRKSRRRVSLERQELASQLKFKANSDFSVHVPRAIIQRIYRQAALGHRLQMLDSRGILLVSQDDWQSNAYRRLDDSLGTNQWFTKGVEVVNVPGDHVTVLDEANLCALAQCFEHTLEWLESPPAHGKGPRLSQ